MQDTIMESLSTELKKALGIFPFSIAPVPGEPELLSVYVYCVPDDKKEFVKHTLNEVEEIFFSDGEYELIPRIKGMRASMTHYVKYYLQFLVKQFCCLASYTKENINIYSLNSLTINNIPLADQPNFTSISTFLQEYEFKSNHQDNKIYEEDNDYYLAA